MSVAENTLHPLEIPDARKAAHTASELQRSVEDEIKRASSALAEAEREYRQALSLKILELHKGGMAWTVCDDVARGEKDVSRLRENRDICAGVLEAMRQQAFRRGADRRDLDTLLNWSMRRDLRTDAPPAEDSERPPLRRVG